ncbi:MAG: DUF2852 domain-containing protein [Pikeienuella sp.]
MNRVTEWITQARDWLDERGKPAWIATMVLGFVFVWPVGLAVLFYMIWSGRMGCSKSNWRRDRSRVAAGTGNEAFDEYKADTMRRLEEEQSAFVGFLDQLRRAKDKAEFDQFMNDRGKSDGDLKPAA